jgi:phosphatidylserine/phosphatidylglycerophosphate/cardiolipin synthase-like enzyme
MDECCGLTGQALVDELHALTKSAKHRVWIASPYIGSWQAVRRILGSAWEKVDTKLMIDKGFWCK